ncbi:MAG: NfeD family protein [Proteobacteria bacterium]|nr:NfeD family protein [Pseudomonadota bacterium]
MTWTQIDWATIAVVLMVAEIVAPGAFMLWLGFAAAGVFLLVLAMPDLAPIWQAAAFCVLAIASVSLYWKLFRKQRVASDQPLLNRRSQQLVGRVYPLETAIVNGRGRVQINDAFWTVEGADAPIGTRVRVVAVNDMSLQVEAVA